MPRTSQSNTSYAVGSSVPPDAKRGRGDSHNCQKPSTNPIQRRWHCRPAHVGQDSLHRCKGKYHAHIQQSVASKLDPEWRRRFVQSGLMTTAGGFKFDTLVAVKESSKGKCRSMGSITLGTNSAPLAFRIGVDWETSRARRAETCEMFPCSGSCTCISLGILLLGRLGCARGGGVAWWAHNDRHMSQNNATQPLRSGPHSSGAS